MSGEGADGAPFPPINNYKGVMLCDRPSAVDAGPSKPAPFNSAVVPPEQLGLNPCKKLNPHSSVAKPKDTSSALYKHKQYLAMLQRDIRKHKSEEEEAKNADAEKRKRFIERSAQLRDAIRAGLLGPTEDSEEAAAPQEAPEQAAEPEPPPPPEPEKPAFKPPEVPPVNMAALGKDSNKELLNKPAWALTEEDAEAKDALQEEVDIDDLLDFVEGLDFEEYIDDYEVQQALEIMKARVTNIDTHRSEAGETKEAGDDAPRAVPIDVSKESEEWNAATKMDAEEPERPYTAESVNAAKEVLQSSRKLRQVHSTASMAAKLAALKEGEEEEEEDGGPKKKEVDPSNLPYLYRNPAV